MNKLARRSIRQRVNGQAEGQQGALVYVGAASCGRAAGALELKEAVKAFLDENKKSARVIEVAASGPVTLSPSWTSRCPQPRVSYNNVNAKTLQMILKSHFVNGEPTRNLLSDTSGPMISTASPVSACPC